VQHPALCERPAPSAATNPEGTLAMSEPEPASITGIHHFSATVRDVEASATWYEQVFSMIRIPITLPHHDRPETGYAVILMDPASGLVIGLHHNEANGGEAFDEADTGLDHIGFNVASRAGLDAWVVKLDGLGIEHSGVRDITEPVPFSTLVFRDPDNIQLELTHQ
jgi:catechol 2,3-dioxygenase-like lactoylglutathione lyase family enzyme